jgi:hypothetical protein
VNKKFVLIQSCFQHLEMPLTHKPAEILFGHEQRHGSPAQDHFVILP